ncbi:hypothetical protein [Aquimarina aquimarini]|uniref:hypothetical protein n=1 Tax=Aquimarina aquimarini TaxID=1191734 RepID=UPI000D55723F|nr:hypothetical protein [Aquimarina aquimarini]
MKNFLRISIVSILLIACTQDDAIPENQNIISNNRIEKNEISETASIDIITHEYDYYGKIFKVTYSLDTKNSTVINVKGDTEIAQEILGKGSASQSVLFYIDEQNNADHLIKSKVFNTHQEVAKYVGHDTLAIADAKNQKNECNDIDNYGPIDYRFYVDIDYFNEMSGITAFKRKDYSKYHLGVYNDRLSSFMCSSLYNWEVSLTLFEDICRSGKSYTFFKSHNAPNLRVEDLRPYTLSGWWFWRQSWNDNVSSFLATSKKP